MALRNFLSQRFFNWHAMAVQLDAEVTIGGSGAPTLVTSSAASSIPTSRGIKSITRLNTGIYQIQLDDNYSQLLDYKANFTAGAGGTVNMGSLVTNTVYRILTIGTSTQAQWVAAGLPVGITAAVGMVFKAAGAGAGNGTTTAVVANAANGIELLTTPSGADQMLNNQPFTQGLGGGYITFQCRAGTAAGTFTGAALAGHTHAILVAAGTAGDAVTNNAGVLNSTGGQDLVTESTSGGTPAGTITGTLPVAADPTSGSTMYLRFLLSNSKVG